MENLNLYVFNGRDTGRDGSIKYIVSFTRFMRIAYTSFNAGIIIDEGIKFQDLPPMTEGKTGATPYFLFWKIGSCTGFSGP